MRRVKRQQRPDDRAIGVGVPFDIEGGELEAPNSAEDETKSDAHQQPDPNPVQVLILRRLLCKMVRDATCQQHARIESAPEQRWRGDIWWPFDGFAAQIEIRHESQPERRGFYQAEADGSPPHNAAMAKGVGRQVGNVENRVQFHRVLGTADGCGSELDSFAFGQNQPVKVMNSGTAPTGIAQGVKIEPMKKPVVATAARKG